MNNKLIIYGIGKFAEYVAYVFQEDTNYDVVAFCVEENYHQQDEIFGKPLIKLNELKNRFPANQFELFIAVGNNQIRKKIFDLTGLENYKHATYVSSKCSKWPNLIVGSNCFIDEGCVLQPFIKIEDNCILFTTDLGHHTIIQKNSLMSGSKTGGNVTIGENSYIGLNASVKQNIKIGKNSIIGMNCAIERNTEENSVYSNKGTVKRNIDALSLGNRFLG
ncbi:acetyltransferase [Gramella lutea]|uniref:Acetyltransferase n=1 Tax=Christiangramia lutea TaxID=1607951 RepID=A0A9X2AC73_9FLAO|nr:acetyltransferase [Christiangramia lutea]MCH4823813.1 acetyltransferase [Christiangramia lutea]